MASARGTETPVFDDTLPDRQAPLTIPPHLPNTDDTVFSKHVHECEQVGLDPNLVGKFRCREQVGRLSSFSRSTGDEERLLRSLLKELGEPRAVDTRLEPISWRLFQVLISRVSAVSAVRYLRMNKFLKSIDLTLENILAKVAEAFDGSGQLVYSSTCQLDKDNKHEWTLCVSISDAVRCVQALSTSKQANSYETSTARDSLKLVLNANIETTAEILGHWLDTLALLSKRVSRDILSRALGVKGESEPFFVLWSSSLTPEQHDLEQHDLELADANFNSRCLGPALLLLSAMKQDKQIRKTETRCLTLRKFILDHLLLPQKSLPATLKLMMGENEGGSSDSTNNQKIRAEFCLNHLIVIFEIGCEHLKEVNQNATAKIKTGTQKLFADLLNVADISLTSTAAHDLSQDQERFLEGLLTQAARLDARLDPTSLQTVALQYGGLSREKGQRNMTNWALVSQIVKIDANVFKKLPNPDISSSSDTITESPLQLLLQALRNSAKLSTSTSSHLEESFSQQVEDRTHQLEIIKNLMLGFSKVRDLMGFFEIWLEELRYYGRELYKMRRKKDISYFFDCIWTHSQLCTSLDRVFESTLTSNQMKELVERFSAPLFSSHGQNADSFSNQISNMFLLVFVLKSVKALQNVASIGDLVDRIWRFISEAILTRDTAFISLYWNALATILQMHGSGVDAQYSLVEQSWLGAARRCFEAFSYKSLDSQKRSILLDSYNAFSFITAAIENQGVDTERNGPFQNLESSVIHLNLQLESLLRSISEGAIPSLPRDWQNTTDNPSLLSVFCLVSSSILITANTALRALSSSTRLNFFQCTYCLGRGFYIHEQSQQSLVDIHVKTMDTQSHETEILDFHQLWKALISTENMKESKNFRSDITATMVNDLLFSTDSPGNEVREQPTLDYAIRSLLKQPSDTFDRRKNDQIVNYCVSSLIDASRPVGDITFVSLRLRLMSSVLQNDNSLSSLLSKPTLLLSLAKSINGNGGFESRKLVDTDTQNKDPSLRRLLSKVFSLVLRQAFRNKEQKRIRIYLVDLYSMIQELVDGQKTLSNDPGEVELLKLTLFSKSILSKMEGSLGHLRDNITQMQNRFVEILKIDAPKMTEDGESSLQSGEGGAFDVAGEWQPWELASWLSCSVGQTQVTVDGLMKIAEQAATAMYASAIGPTGSSNLAKARRRDAIRQLQLRYDTSTTETRDEFLCNLAVSSDDSLRNPYRMVLLQQLLRTTGSSTISSKTLSKIYMCNLSNLFGASDALNILAQLKAMEAMVQKPDASNQWTIEESLRAVHGIVTTKFKKIGSRSGASVYLCSCQTLRAIFKMHLQRLRGRYHLILPILQALLRRLFFPVERQTRGRNRSHTSVAQITVQMNDQQHALGAKEASALGRLVLMLTDPSISIVSDAGVSRSNKQQQQQLTPATDKARKMAAQHLAPLLMDFANLQLHGRLLVDAREALVPALHALFDVAGPDRVRALNASMDGQSRAIFKTMHQDYQGARGSS